MFGRLTLVRLKAAENALKDGRLDEAYRLATAEDLRDHRRAQKVLVKAAKKFVARAKAHFDAGLYDRGLADLDKAAAARPLITTGIYKHIRHPIYAAGFLICLAHPAWFGCRFSWLLLIISWPAILIRMWREERLLLKNMDGYRKYAERTKRIIPGVF